MGGRIRIAVVGLFALTTVYVSAPGAGAQTGQWSVQANGGFVSLDLVDTLQFAGGGSQAAANSAPLAEASGTGACLSTAASTNPCPADATAPLSGLAAASTQDAVAGGAGLTATPTGSSKCPVPMDAGVTDVTVACGTAVASEDTGGDPTASGTGSLDGATVNVSVTDFLERVLGGPSLFASSVCDGVPAASGTGRSNPRPLTPAVRSFLTTVNAILPAPLALNATSVAGGSDVRGECSVLSGMLTQLDASKGASPATGIVSGILNQVLGLRAAKAATVQPLSIDLGGSTSSVRTSGNVVTDAVTRHSMEVNLFGLAQLQVAPTTASVALDRDTGTVTPSCNAGRAAYSVNGSLPAFVTVTQLTGLVDQVLAEAGAGSALGSALGSLLTGILSSAPGGNPLTCAVSGPGPTASARVGVLDLGLLGALQGGIGLDVGDVAVSGTSTAAGVATSAATTGPTDPAAPPAAVPGVTSVHTGEYWAGPLPIVVIAGAALAGLILIGRRRVGTVVRSLTPTNRRRDGP